MLHYSMIYFCVIGTQKLILQKHPWIYKFSLYNQHFLWRAKKKFFFLRCTAIIVFKSAVKVLYDRLSFLFLFRKEKWGGVKLVITKLKGIKWAKAIRFLYKSKLYVTHTYLKQFVSEFFITHNCKCTWWLRFHYCANINEN